MNHMKRRFFVCGVLCCFVIFLLGFGFYKKNSAGLKYLDQVIGIYILDQTGQEMLDERTAGEFNEEVVLFLEGCPLPLDAGSQTVYLSQSLKQEEWIGSLVIGEGFQQEGYILCSLEDEYWYQKNKAIQENHVFELYLLSDESYIPVSLIVTGMPTMSIVTEYCVEAEEVDYEVDPDKKYYGSETMYYGDLLVFDPDMSGDTYQITRSRTSYHEKGASSRSFPKKSYDIELLDEADEEYKAPLLGMRNDDDWKLNSLYTDNSRVREKTASQMWELIDEENSSVQEAGPRMEYVEVIMDYEYIGVYTLVEPVDAKKCDLDNDNDVLYKSLNWSAPSVENIEESMEKGWKISGNTVRIRHPKEINDYDAAWEPIYNYLSLFYYGEYDSEAAWDIINLENIADYFIFTQITSASDNTFKNMYYSVRRDDDGDYQIIQRPWDLDLTFGNIYSYVSENNSEFSSDYMIYYGENAINELWYDDKEKISEIVIEKWVKYRDSILSLDNTIGLLTENADYLQDTGAIIREGEKWPDSEVSTDISQIVEYQSSRMEWVNQFMYEWTGTVEE